MGIPFQIRTLHISAICKHGTLKLPFSAVCGQQWTLATRHTLARTYMHVNVSNPHSSVVNDSHYPYHKHTTTQDSIRFGSSSCGTNDTQEGFATRAIHVGQDSKQWSFFSVVPPLVMSSTFRLGGPDQKQGSIYGRLGNPTRNVLEACMASLENGKHAVTFASGMGAISAVGLLLQNGEHLISGDNVYGGTDRFFNEGLTRYNIKTTFADPSDVQNIMNAVKPNTKMVWLESPTNPLLRVPDIRNIAETVKCHRPDIIIVVDNSFLTCYFQRPLDLGADITVYSVTKFMNGHSDVIMGAAITKRDDLNQRLRFLQNAMGIIPSPFDCAQVNRSLKTLEVRMEQHMKNGIAVGKFLEQHPLVEKVMHPYLPSHPQYELSLKQTSGHSGMVAFYMKGDSSKFLKSLKIFTLALSLGGYESLAELPSTMTHASLSEDMRKKLGITHQLIRLSVGLESEKDLLQDLDQALEAAQC